MANGGPIPHAGRSTVLYDLEDNIDLLQDTVSDLFSVMERRSSYGSSSGSSNNVNSFSLSDIESARNKRKTPDDTSVKRPDQMSFVTNITKINPVQSFLEIIGGKYDRPCCEKGCFFVKKAYLREDDREMGSGAGESDFVPVLSSSVLEAPTEVVMQRRQFIGLKSQKERSIWVEEQLRSCWLSASHPSSSERPEVEDASQTNSGSNTESQSNTTQTCQSRAENDKRDILPTVEFICPRSGTRRRHNVCSRAWMFIHGVSRRMYYTKLKSMRNEEKSISQINSAISKATESHPECADLSAETLELIAFVREFAAQFGEHNPTSQETRINFDRVYIYECFQKRYPERKIMSLSNFYKIWNNYLADIRKCAWKGDHLKCDTCLALAKEDCNPHLSQAEHERIRIALQDHRATVLECRQEYWRRRERGKRYPETFLSIIIDGCDQKKTQLPSFRFRSKEGEKYERYAIAHKLVGAIVHGIPNRVHTYFVPANSAKVKGSNLTIEVLQRTLWKEQERRKAIGAMWPEVLYLQLDNTTSENKNKYVFAYLSSLIQKGVFREIHVNFLPVGHTHEDIDQFFSQFAHRMRAVDCFTYEDAVKVLQKCHDPTHQVLEETDYLFALHEWRSWISQDLNEAYQGFLKQAYHFRLKKDPERITVPCQYQIYSYHVSGPNGEENYLPKAPYEIPSWLKTDAMVLSNPPVPDSSAGSWENTPYYAMALEELSKKHKPDKQDRSNRDKNYKPCHEEVIQFLLEKIEKMLSLTSNSATDEHILWWRDWLENKMPVPGEELSDALTCPKMFTVFEPYILPEGTICQNAYYDRMRYQGVPAPAAEDDLLIFTGHTQAQRAQVARIQEEIVVARKCLAPIEKNTFIAFMVSDEWKELGSTQKGLNENSTSLPFTLGKTMEEEKSCVPNSKVKVHVYYTQHGNPNDVWKPWIHQGRGQRKWCITISRECIVLVDITLTKKGTILCESKKAMGEVPAFPYLYVTGFGLITKEKAVDELTKQLNKLRRKKDKDSVSAARGIETRLCHIQSLLSIRDRHFKAHSFTEEELEELQL